MKYFTIEELCKSAVADKYHIDNSPSQRIRENLTELVDNCLDPLREAWGSPIRITSGYRCKALNSNKEVKGSSSSAHLTGFAADMQPVNGDMVGFQNFVVSFLKDRKFDQILHEYPVKGVDRWVHVGYRNGKGLQRKQIKTIR